MNIKTLGGNSLPKPEPVINTLETKRWPRDARVAAKALSLSDYKCAYDESHTSFISKVTDKRYLEVHHLVPMMYHGDFDVSLDRTAQLLALCPTCYRQIHHGNDEEKKKMLRKLYLDRQNELRAVGVEVNFNTLCNMYGIED